MPALRFATVSSGLVERHRADPTGPDRELLPAFAVVAAREEPSVGQPGEQPFGGRDERVRHRVERPRQPRLDPLPRPGALPPPPPPPPPPPGGGGGGGAGGGPPGGGPPPPGGGGGGGGPPPPPRAG